MDFSLQSYGLLALAYILGSIPFGLLLTRKVLGTDIRNIGSGNIGATNVMRTGNKKLAALTLILDLVKGSLAVSLAYIFSEETLIPMLAAVLAVLGHVFPLWLKFKGGKGVATALGVWLALNPLVALASAVLWLVIFKITRISSLSAITALAASPVFAWFCAGSKEATLPLTLTAFVIALLVIGRHYENVQRLIKGEESRFAKPPQQTV